MIRLNWLNNKKWMIAIMVLLMVSSSFGMGIIQLNQKASAIREEFLVGEYKDGFSIQRDLDTRISTATNMITLAKKYQVEDSYINAVQQATIDLKEADTIAVKYRANEALTVAVSDLRLAMDQITMSETNQKSWKEQLSIFQNAQNTISYDPYNTLVADYEKKTQGILASFMKHFTKKVEYFR
ncbi:MAG: hypothetical protein PUF50_01345 [Erysipelotrichaceae bacterium]|nr:hypothetical protein [Erysipelotrichaceae bacterium]